ncbi:MAG: hypothetical protein ACTSVM_06535, partial [Candidatus Ranarchaeia archaeon]
AVLSIVIGVPSNFLGFAIIGKLSRITDEINSKWLIRFLVSGFIGLLIGAAYIGYGLVLYSYGYLFNEIFVLPTGFESELSLLAGSTITLWTFISEIPFVYLAIVIIKPVMTAFPGIVLAKSNYLSVEE